MRTCPEGHSTTATDYCDVCGAPMTAAAPSVAASPMSVPAPTSGPSGPSGADDPSVTPDAAEPAANTQACPHCGAVNAGDNLFCEVCGFDFTTGVMPRVEGGEPTYLPPVTPLAPPEDPASPASPVADVIDDPVEEADPADPDEHDDLEERDEHDGEVQAAAAEVPAAPASAPDKHVGTVDEAVSVPSARPVNRPPSRHVAGDWVVEVWIDPDWFAVQDSGEDFPSVAPPEVVRLTGSDALVGRRSRTGVPDVDCGLDSAVSRRHALLTSDGRRWWVEDLDSSNGTWVGPAVGPLPDSPISGRVEVDADDRIYVGAWTRLVVRPAVESEIES